MLDLAASSDLSRAEIEARIVRLLQNGRHKAGVQGMIAELMADLWVEVGRLRADNERLMADNAVIEALRTVRKSLDIPLPGSLPETLELPSGLNIAASDSMDAGDGFHAVEWTEAGLPCRWSGPSSTSKFAIYIDRASRLEGILSVVALAPGVSHEDVRCFVDGHQVALSWGRSDMGEQIATFRIDPRETRAVSEIVLAVDTMFSAPQVDSRRIGICFSSLQLRPVA